MDDANGKWTPVLLVGAIAVLAAFGLVLRHMLQITGTADERTWTRAIYLFGSVEAIAFAAAGFLFGREVHREQAAKAERRADTAEKSTKDALKTALDAEAKGKALARLAAAKAAGLRHRREAFAKSSGDSADIAGLAGAEADLQELAKVAADSFFNS
ncbi:MAG: hypothetical protein HYV14_16580 [Elusimicrobia bacterium]|nr:hypothetical protein [Elusimicrobiota bacterium]